MKKMCVWQIKIYQHKSVWSAAQSAWLENADFIIGKCSLNMQKNIFHVSKEVRK